MLDSGSESAPTTPAARPSLRGKGCAGNSGLSHHVRVVRALEWVAVGDAAGRQGLGDAPGGGSPGQDEISLVYTETDNLRLKDISYFCFELSLTFNIFMGFFNIRS